MRLRFHGVPNPGDGKGTPPVVRGFHFAYNTPGILTGATLYTPTPGDILMNGWFAISTPWNGTDPFGDFGTFVGTNNGFYNGVVGAGCAFMKNTDLPVNPGEPVVGFNTSLADVALLSYPTNDFGPGLYKVNGSDTGGSVSGGVNFGTVNTVLGPVILGSRYLPFQLTGDPIKVCVSHDGTPSGADPGSTQGAATLYLMTATPIIQ